MYRTPPTVLQLTASPGSPHLPYTDTDKVLTAYTRSSSSLTCSLRLKNTSRTSSYKFDIQINPGAQQHHLVIQPCFGEIAPKETIKLELKRDYNEEEQKKEVGVYDQINVCYREKANLTAHTNNTDSAQTIMKYVRVNEPKDFSTVPPFNNLDFEMVFPGNRQSWEIKVKAKKVGKVVGFLGMLVLGIVLYL